MHFASKKGHLEIVNLLLQHGANVNCLNKNNYTPLHFASRQGHTKIVEKLIENGADLNWENDRRSTPLHLATKNGKSEIVKVLLESNACLTMKNIYDKTALDIAKEKKDKKSYRMIYEKIIESMSSKDNSPECSKDNCQKEMKRMMLEKMNVTFISKEGKTCVVCFDDRNGTFVFLPCGHAKTRQKCSNRIIEESKRCPLCRKAVSKYQKVYD